MNSDREVRAAWALEWVNGQQFIGRYLNQWTRGSIGTALLFTSKEDAEQALQALHAEANDRMNDKNDHPTSFWLSVYGGLVLVRELDIITQRHVAEDVTADV